AWPACSRRRARSSGTARWACSSSTPSRAARRRWRGPSPRRRLSPLPGVVIRWRRSRSTASQTRLGISRPAAAPSSSSWKARRSPRSLSWRSAPHKAPEPVDRPSARATKIVATLGPASSSADTLARMIRAGVDVVRLNFSHGTAEDHAARAGLVRAAALACDREVAIMADLQGPKIRIGKFAEGKVQLEPGQPFVLDATCELGDASRVGLDYPDLPRDVQAGDILLLNDGLIRLRVTRVAGSEIHTEVLVGGELSNNKG